MTIRDTHSAEGSVADSARCHPDRDLLGPSALNYQVAFGQTERWILRSDKAGERILRDLADVLGLGPAQDHDSKWLHFVTTPYPKFRSVGTSPRDRTELGTRLERLGWSHFSLELVRFWTDPLQRGVVCELADSYHGTLRSIMMLQALHPLYQSVIRSSGGLFLHAAAVTVSGKAFLVVGPGGTGKTTFCNRCPSSWTVMSDDQAVVIPDRTHGYLVHPFPNWTAPLTGREHGTTNSQTPFPLVGIFFLEKAGIDDIIAMGEGECASRLNMSALEAGHILWHQQSDAVKGALKTAIFSHACEIARSVPAAFRLRATLGSSNIWNRIEALLNL